MALKLLYHTSNLLCVAGYESGHCAVQRHVADSNNWDQIYLTHPHSQPVLSLDLSPVLTCFFSSAADDVVARHLLSPESKTHVDETPRVLHTKHSGQQGLRVRSDAKIFATAGWDSRVRVYSAKTLKELAVLKWHKEGCYAVDFADVDITTHAAMDQAPESKGNQLASSAASSSKQLQSVTARREMRAQSTHWLAVGSKDGRVSLWDIY